MADNFHGVHQAMALEVGLGPEESVGSRDLRCPGCRRTFKRESELHRHWRLPIPCEMEDCTQTFRDDKESNYIKHHTTRHSIDGQLTIDQGRLEEYFRMKKGEYRNNIRPDLCTMRNPTTATAFQDASINRLGNLEQDDFPSSRITQGDKVASYALGERPPPLATGSSLSARVSELKQKLSYECQFIDHLKKLVLKTERDKEDLERKIKLLGEIVESSPPDSHSRTHPSLNQPFRWMDLISWDEEHEETSEIQ